MKRKSSAVVLLAVAALTVNSALPGQAAAKKAKDVKIAAVVKGLDNPFFISIKEGIEETALKYGIRANVQAAPGLNDDVGQANKLDSLAGQNYDCYIVIPISSNNLSQAVGKITKKKKTVINIDSPIDATSLAAAGGKVSSFAGTDNFAAGKAGGKDMVAKIGTGKTIGLIAGLAGNVTSAARIDGFKAGALEADPTVKFVGPENADWDTTKALDKANAMLLANPKIDAFFAANAGNPVSRARARQARSQSRAHARSSEKTRRRPAPAREDAQVCSAHSASGRARHYQVQVLHHRGSRDDGSIWRTRCDAGDAACHAGEGRRAVRHLGGALEGEGDVLRGERRAVVEFDAGAKLEFPHRVAERLPRQGESRHRPLLGVARHQRIEDVQGDLVIGRTVLELRIERGRLVAQADPEFLGCSLPCECKRHERQQGGAHQPASQTPQRHETPHLFEEGSLRLSVLCLATRQDASHRNSQ